MHGYSMLRTYVSGPYFHDIYDTCDTFGVALEGLHTETGPGVYEAALAYTDALRMADNAILFKLTSKALGYKYDIMPTFMAKPHNGLPGCSGHIHVSLQDSSGRNIFATPDGKERADAKWDDLRYVSQEMGECARTSPYVLFSWSRTKTLFPAPAAHRVVLGWRPCRSSRCHAFAGPYRQRVGEGI